MPEQTIDIVIDGPPGQDPGRFVEVEDANGAGISVGEWIDRGDGNWALRLCAVVESDPPDYNSVAVAKSIVTQECHCAEGETCAPCDLRRGIVVALNRAERWAHARERDAIAKMADDEVASILRAATDTPEGHDGESAAWSAHATMVDFVESIRERSAGPTDLLAEARRKRLHDKADVLERAVAVDANDHPKPNGAKDNPEGTFVVKMTETIRRAVVTLLREAADA